MTNKSQKQTFGKPSAASAQHPVEVTVDGERFYVRNLDLAYLHDSFTKREQDFLDQAENAEFYAKVLAARNEGWSLRQLADHFGIPNVYVWRAVRNQPSADSMEVTLAEKPYTVLKSSKEVIRKQVREKVRLLETAVNFSERRQLIIQMHLDGSTAAEIAEKLSITRVRVYQILKKDGYTMSQEETAAKFVERKQLIIQMHLAGSNQTAIAKKLSMSKSRVCQILKKDGYAFNREKTAAKFEERRQLIIQMHFDGSTPAEIAEKLSVKRDRVYQVLTVVNLIKAST